jgi:predicted O-methyltransferase YrrM
VRIEQLHRLNIRAKPLRHRAWARVLRAVGRPDEAAIWISRLARGSFDRDETRLLYRTARELPSGGDVAEVGSWMGRTSIILGLAVRDSGARDRRIFAIDPHMGSEEHEEFIARHGSTFPDFQRNVAKAGVSDLVEPLLVTSVEGARELATRGVRLRLAFIDGAHDEDSVRGDIRAFLPLLLPGGLLAFHDCEEDGGFPGVWKAFSSELGRRSTIVARAHSLLVTRPGS